MVQEQVGELGYGEDVDEIEEQLQGGNSLLACVPRTQHARMIRPVHRLCLLSISSANDRPYSRTDGRLFVPPKRSGFSTAVLRRLRRDDASRDRGPALPRDGERRARLARVGYRADSPLVGSPGDHGRVPSWAEPRRFNVERSTRPLAPYLGASQSTPEGPPLEPGPT